MSTRTRVLAPLSIYLILYVVGKQTWFSYFLFPFYEQNLALTILIINIYNLLIKNWKNYFWKFRNLITFWSLSSCWMWVEDLCKHFNLVFCSGHSSIVFNQRSKECTMQQLHNLTFEAQLHLSWMQFPSFRISLFDSFTLPSCNYQDSNIHF